MTVIYIVLPLALLLSTVGVLAFIWAVRRGQLDDTQTPAVRILHDEETELDARPRQKPASGSPKT